MPEPEIPETAKIKGKIIDETSKLVVPPEQKKPDPPKPVKEESE